MACMLGSVAIMRGECVELRDSIVDSIIYSASTSSVLYETRSGSGRQTEIHLGSSRQHGRGEKKQAYTERDTADCE